LKKRKTKKRKTKTKKSVKEDDEEL